MQENKPRNSEAGNVFLFILIGVVLFAAISFTMSRGFRSEGTSKMSEQRAGLVATQLLDFSQKLVRGVDKMRRNGCSESDIRFTGHPTWGTDTTTVPEKCKIGSPEGAGIPKITYENDWFADGSPSNTLSASMRAQNVGTNSAELIYWFRGITRELCLAINTKLGISNPGGVPPRDTTSNAFDGVGFTGSFGGASNIIDAPELIGKHSGCFVSNIAAGGATHDQYYFVTIIIAR